MPTQSHSTKISKVSAICRRQEERKQVPKLASHSGGRLRTLGLKSLSLGMGLAVALVLSPVLATAESSEYYESPPLTGGLIFKEAPSLADRVSAGDLPPLTERLPKHPLIVPLTSERSIGTYGGSLATLVTRSKDTRLMTVFGYARLIGYDEDLTLRPDIL